MAGKVDHSTSGIGGKASSAAGQHGGGSADLGGGSGAGGSRSASVTGNRFGAPSASTQAAAMARNAPTNSPFGGGGTQQQNMRRSVNPTPSYEMNLHNMLSLGNMLAPGGLVRAGLGIGPQGFTGSTGMMNGPGDYDPKDRPLAGIGMPAGMAGGAVTPAAYQALMAQQQPMMHAPAPVKPFSGLMQQFMPGMNLNIGPATLPSYGAQMPGYNFFGPAGIRKPLV